MGVENLAEKNNKSSDLEINKFWFCTYPLFSSTIYVYQKEKEANKEFVIYVYDSSGNKINTIKINNFSGVVFSLDVNSIIESCKLDSGLKHGWLEISHSNKLKSVLKYNSNNNSISKNKLKFISNKLNTFYNINFKENKSYSLVLLNFSDHLANVKLQLILSKSLPDKSFFIPPKNIHIFQLEDYFNENINDINIHAYLKVILKTDNEMAVCLLENINHIDGLNTYNLL